MPNNMKSEVLALCEYASDHDGSLTIVDTFDNIMVAKLPWRAYFYVATRISFVDCEVDYKTVLLKIVSLDEQEKVVFETTSPFNPPNELKKMNIVAGFKGLIFESAGEYCFRLYMDDNLINEYPFKVILKENE